MTQAPWPDYAGNEIHVGLITPMASTDMVRASRHLSSEDRARNQMAYDIMSLNAPGLCQMPFDKPEKGFSRDAEENSVFRGGPPSLLSSMRTLTIYADEIHEPDTSRRSNSQDFRKSIAREMQEYWQAAKDMRLHSENEYREALDAVRGGSNITRDAQAAMQIILCGTVERLCLASR